MPIRITGPNLNDCKLRHDFPQEGIAGAGIAAMMPTFRTVAERSYPASSMSASAVRSASPHFDLLWSDKVGYIFISVDPIRGTVADSDSWVVECAEDLLDKLLYEMAVDFMESNGHTLDPKEASKMERAEIERRLEPFVTQLSAGPEHIQRTLLNLRVIENYRLSKPAYCRKTSLY